MNETYMEACCSQVLSLGNNMLPSTEGLLYLKCLDKLRVLNLSGNPVCSDPEYRP
jgi:hypothetical protein